MSNLQQAKEIAKKYKFALPKEYKGYKMVWHPWHQPASRLLWPMTFDQYIDRIVEIGTLKPENERAERFGLMKISLIQPKGKAYAAKQNTDAAWWKADAAWQKALAAREKAYAAWLKTDAAKIKAAHERECPNCKWDGYCLPQFN